MKAYKMIFMISKQMPVFNRNLLLFAICLFTLSALSAIFFQLPAKSGAQVKIPENVATQGRSLTPAGKLIVDAATNLPAVAPLTVDFVRSPDDSGADGKGRFLIAVNSGFGLTFNSKSKAQQTLSVIDTEAKPEPQVVQNVYFPTPNSANIGVTFSAEKDADASFTMFVAGGFENRVWIFKFNPNEKQPISPGNQPDTDLKAGFIDVSAFSDYAPSPYYNRNQSPVYPTGIALSPDNTTLYVANNLGDSLGILQDWKGARKITKVSLKRRGSTQFVYPYDVEILPETIGGKAAKVYVSLWGDARSAVVNPENPAQNLKHIAVERHPTTMILNRDKSKLFVVNSDADSVSVIDTAADRVIEKINVKLAENALGGMTPEGLTLSADEKTLYVANSHVNAVAVVWLWRQWQNLLYMRERGVPVLGFTWYSLIDQVDWDTELREANNRVNPFGLYDMNRKIRPVGEAYKQIIEEYKEISVVPRSEILSVT